MDTEAGSFSVGQSWALWGVSNILGPHPLNAREHPPVVRTTDVPTLPGASWVKLWVWSDKVKHESIDFFSKSQAGFGGGTGWGGSPGRHERSCFL